MAALSQRDRPAPQGEHVGRAHPHRQGQGLLTVGGEDHVGRVQRGGDPRLVALLTDQRRPQPELPVALQRGALDVEPAAPAHSAEHLDQAPVTAPPAEAGVLDELPLGREQPHRLRRILDVHHRSSHRTTTYDQVTYYLVTRGEGESPGIRNIPSASPARPPGVYSVCRVDRAH